ncbi:unnamed protein product [Linum trigynum]|uniref:Transposase n=1 Tax=Linum trigynum TaxID=586398 RepID=A0AAV2DXB7_9ROSI
MTGSKKIVGVNEKLFKMEVRVICKMMAPIGKYYWKHVTEEDKKPIFQKLQNEFDISITSAATRKTIDFTLSRRFTSWKHLCHMHYQKLGPAKARQTTPENINIDDWTCLCDHFESAEFKRQSVADKQNKGKQTYAHTTGGKSCSQRMFEIEKANHAATDATTENNDDSGEVENSSQPSAAVEEEPKELRVYAGTHKKLDGSWVNVQPEHNYKAPSDVRKAYLISEREKELEARLETSLADADKQRQEFEDKIKSQQDQIEKQEEEIRGHKVSIDAFQASQDSLKEYVESLAAKINGGNT